MTARASGRGACVLTTMVTVLLAACAAPAPAPSPTPVAIPADWVEVTTVDGAMQMTLPPWLVVADNNNAIHAESAPVGPGTETTFYLFALEPGMSLGFEEPFRLRPGEDLEIWIRDFYAEDAPDQVSITRVTLPAGVSVRFDGIVGAGTLEARRIMAFAMTRPAGIVLFHIVGPVAGWSERAADIELVPLTFQLR
jgi:hypothetical protein